MKEFKEFLLKNRKEKTIRFFYDIETLQYNEKLGRQKPSEYKNVMYSFAFGYYDEKQLKVKILSNSKDFFDIITKTYIKWKTTPRIELIAHNSNGYDNHYIRKDLIYYYDLPVKNLYLKNATDDGNVLTVKKTALTKVNKNGVILEKRIKSSNNLELNFYLKGVEFFTTDNLIKTNTSLANIGKKLYKLGYLTKDDLKTDFDYKKFNLEHDMTEEESYNYAKEVFKQLNKDELLYIRNDIIILATCVMYYGQLYKGFDYNKITFTSNILEYYNDNDLTSYQLLKSVGQGKDKRHLKYTNYIFGGENFYDYLKSFYAGGLNFYNDRLIGKIIDDTLFSMDLNSSYPYVMHNYKVPTFLKDFQEFKKETKIKILLNEDFYLYRMSKRDFDNDIITKIESKIVRQMLVKYYSKNDYVNINSYTIRLIKNITGLKINYINVLSYVSFECEYFASRDKINEKYKIKEQGSSKKKLIYNNPYDIIETDEDNTEHFSDSEIDISKVILNGLYGIPALRSHFNIFRWVHDELKNVPNGYENNERNIVFSVFVTSVSLYNLLNPLKYLSQQEIDKYFVYCDTDSLYLNKKIYDKLPSDLFHTNHLGKWAIEELNINKFIVINHKKYAYENDKKEIIVKCGGIPLDSFNLNMSFEKFVTTQFSEGVDVKNQKSIFNKQGTISIYDSTTTLKVGSGYRIFANDLIYDNLKNKMLDEIRNSNDGSVPDMLYIESNLGTFSLSDVFPHEHDTDEKQTLNYLKVFERNIRKYHLHY